jgi:hypothetical protein
LFSGLFQFKLFFLKALIIFRYLIALFGLSTAFIYTGNRTVEVNAHALGFLVSTSRLLTADLNIETITSNHYEVFLSFRVQSPWNLGTRLKLSWALESYVPTDGQSANLSWFQAPIWALRPDFYYCQTIEGVLMWGALSDERTGLPFTIATGPRQRSHSSA